MPSNKTKVVITGGTGFIGQSLAKHLKSKGLEPVVIARSKPKIKLPCPFVAWDAVTVGEWAKELEGAFAVVNLAGKTVDCIKTPDNCDLILRSRVDSTLAVGKALIQAQNPPKIWIQMSTAHIYGDPPKQVCTEDSSFGYGLAPTVGKAWEQALADSLVKLPYTREVRLRTSFVVGKDGGALEALARITKMGLGGKVGHGQQGFSWLHEYDMNEVIYQSIVNESYKGAYIVSAPNPVSNEVFMRTLRKTLGVSIGLPAKEWMVRIGAKLFFNTDPELALYGRYVLPSRLLEEGYEFKFPELKGALEDLLG